MMAETALRRYLGVLGLAIFLLVTSFDSVLKYFGVKGLVLYFVIGTGLLLLGYRFLIPAFHNSISEKYAIYLAVLAFLFLISLVAYVYPIANSGRFGGGGDIDDAMIIGATEIIHGHYPYYKQTYLGGLLSPMPGTILLSVPFVFLNLLPYQNIFWLSALFLAVRSNLKSGVYALSLLLTILLFSPTFYQVLVTGSDHISNSIYVIIGMWFMVRAVTDPASSIWQRLWPTVLLGVGLSSRSNFLLLMPLLFSVLAQNAGWKDALKYVALALAVFLTVTGPFWIYDPAGFSPLVVQSIKINSFESILPYSGIIIPATAVTLSLALSWMKMGKDCAVFFRNAAIVQLFVLLFTSILFAVKSGEFTLFMGTAGYGLFTLFFGVLGIWITLNKRDERMKTILTAKV